MESLRKAFGFSKEHASREGDAFDQELQGQLKEKRRIEHEEQLKANEEKRLKDAKRREKEKKRKEKERKEAEKLRKKEEKKALKERKKMEKKGIKIADDADARGGGGAMDREGAREELSRLEAEERRRADMDREMDGYMAKGGKGRGGGGGAGAGRRLDPAPHE